uniref:Recep_L_domain domain-containing protein n=1 Tax=Heterorhabditis bacteriophora TaxID=37862 RepID=A0A1I7WBM0_HETBA
MLPVGICDDTRRTLPLTRCYALNNCTASRSRLEYNVFQEFLNTNGEGITLGILLKARDGGSMIRLDYLNNTIQLLDLVSTGFLMHDYDLGRNESFNQFCGGFCQVNEPIRQFFVSSTKYKVLLHGFLSDFYFQIGMNILSTNNSDSLAGRIDLSYPSSTMFGRKFSLLVCL